MHELFNGPLKHLLEKHLRYVDPALINTRGINISSEIASMMKVGALQEDFEIKGVRGEPEDLTETLVGLMDRLYEVVGLARNQPEENGICEYIPKTSGRGLGTLVTFTIDRRASRIMVTVQNFEF